MLNSIKIQKQISKRKYDEVTEQLLLELNVKIVYVSQTFGYHFNNDTQQRYINKIKLQRNKKQFSFKFGQSIFKGNEKPSAYDIISNLQKYDVGSYENFCDEYAYNVEDKSAKKTYKLLTKEYENMCSLFNDYELDLLNEIQ